MAATLECLQALSQAGLPQTQTAVRNAGVVPSLIQLMSHASPRVSQPAAALVRAGPSVMIGDPFGFDMVNDPNTQEQVKLTTFTPQITLFMTTMWIVEYCTHHGIPLGTGIWR